MRKIVIILVIMLYSVFNVYSLDTIYGEIGEKSDNYIIVNCNCSGKKDVTIKYYLNPYIWGNNYRETIYFDSNNRGNVYVHNIAIYWNGKYYKPVDNDNVIKNIWISQRVSEFLAYNITNYQDTYWLKMSEENESFYYKLPYVSGFEFVAPINGINIIYLRFIKRTEDIVTNINSIYNDNNTQHEYYNLLGQKVPKSYRGIKIIK